MCGSLKDGILSYLLLALIQMDSPILNSKVQAENEANKTVVIVAKPGRIRDSLEALLRTIPRIKAVAQADNGTTALEMVAGNHPDLVLVIADLPDEETGPLLKYLKGSPRIQCLVLTNTRLHMERAKAAGADGTLLAGFPTDELFERVTSLLSA